MRRAVLFGFFAALTISTAHAQTEPALPEWNAREHCERQNRMIGSESAVMLRSCMDAEARALTILRRDWENATPGSRRTCIRQGETIRSLSYFMLNSCIQMERDATRDLQRR
jgi:hypothetical protein